MSWLSGTKFAVFGLGDSTYSSLEVGNFQVKKNQDAPPEV